MVQTRIQRIDYGNTSVSFNSDRVSAIEWRKDTGQPSNRASIVIYTDNGVIAIRESDINKIEDLRTVYLNAYTQWKNYNEFILQIDVE